LFAVGITFMGAGVAIGIAAGWPAGIGLVGIGLVLELVGLKNRDKWEK
jgi:hypothetical protein